jgi:hypothetical protein
MALTTIHVPLARQRSDTADAGTVNILVERGGRCSTNNTDERVRSARPLESVAKIGDAGPAARAATVSALDHFGGGLGVEHSAHPHLDLGAVRGAEDLLADRVGDLEVAQLHQLE